VGQTPKTHETRDLIHILIGREEDDPDVEIRSITTGLAWLMIAKANGNRELVNAIRCCQTWDKIRRSISSRNKRNPRKPRRSRRPKKSHRDELLWQAEGKISPPQAKAQAHGPSWSLVGAGDISTLSLDATAFRAVTSEDILNRAKEIL